MSNHKIYYRSGYKYQVAADYTTTIDIKPEALIETDYIRLDPTGKLTIRKSYAWDGPSGPAIDTVNFMRGSLLHDCLYQLLREGHLKPDQRDPADRLLQEICVADGMTKIRAWWVYWGVRFGGGPAADPANNKPIMEAPRW